MDQDKYNDLATKTLAVREPDHIVDERLQDLGKRIDLCRGLIDMLDKRLTPILNPSFDVRDECDEDCAKAREMSPVSESLAGLSVCVTTMSDHLRNLIDRVEV